MCRINGIIDRTNRYLENDTIKMRDAMYRGGPDSWGVYTDQSKNLSLGHRRLAIIDICETGSQPMKNLDESIILVFNGEIYNYLALKKELLIAGYSFSSHSDTEVIILSYQHWGIECFKRFKGMFALALYDKKNGELVLARDHAGIKPLYYALDKNCLCFASEIRAFKQLDNGWPENPEWRAFFLTYGYLPANTTTLKNVVSLEKGSYLIVDVNTLQSFQGYFSESVYAENIIEYDLAKKVIRTSLENAVERHLIADAPLGLFLSGGIDSSLLTLIASKYKKPLHTLSIIFNENNFSEKKYQDLIARKVQSEHQSFLLTREIFLDALPDIMQAMDQPSADGINSYFISMFAKKAGLKAVLSGLGADELFGGYPSFTRDKLLKSLRSIPSGFLGMSGYLGRDKYKKINYLKNKSPIGDYLFNRGFFIPAEAANLLDMTESQVTDIVYNIPVEHYLDDISFGNKTSYLETNLYMEHQLLKDTDCMSMWHSLEVRVPFLDYDFMKIVHQISSQLKFGNKQGKHLLISSFDDLLPEAIWNRTKQGFSFPFDVWMKENPEQFVKGRHNLKLKKRFQEGKLSWSRYWTYLVSQSFNA